MLVNSSDTVLSKPFLITAVDWDRELPGYVQREFDDYLKYGRVEHGFLRVRYESCHPGYLDAFSLRN